MKDFIKHDFVINVYVLNETCYHDHDSSIHNVSYDRCK